MQGNKWDTLVEALRKFIQERVNIERKYQKKDTISVIGFNHQTTVLFKNEVIDEKLIDKLVYKSGGTSFANALKAFVELLKEQINLNKMSSQQQKIIAVFQSDGADKYPEIEVSDIKANYHHLIK